jgi:carboxyl-terminal processing protease
VNDPSQPLRRSGGAIARAVVVVLLAALLGGCYAPGFGPTPTIAPAAKTAVALPPTPTPTRITTRTAAATSPRTPTPPPAARTPTPGPNSFTATAAQPCRAARFNGIIKEKKSTVETVGQAYRCFLLFYVDRATLDHTILLNGAWSALGPLGKGKFTPDDLVPLALGGDRETDWAVFAARFAILIERGQGTVDTSTLARAAIAAMADSLNDNHVAYIEPKYWRNTINAELGLEYIPTAGFEIALDDATGQFYLYTVFPGSPADLAGLQAGDLIDNVGGTPVGVGKVNRPLGDLMNGLPGTGNTVQITRPATGQTETVIIEVADVEVPLIEIAILPGKIGYLRLRHFSFTSGQSFDRALAALQARGITSLIFDVRQNPGGSTAALAHILSHFTHEGPLAIMIDEHGTHAPMQPDTGVPLLNLPWAVLCDGDSASSSDVTAAVAKARGGRLIGTRSAGALSGALYYELEDGSALEISVIRVLGPDGEAINEIGVTPHDIVPLTPADLSAGLDPPLQRAIDYLAAGR